MKPTSTQTAAQAPKRHRARRTTVVLLPLWLLAAVMAVIASISVAIMAILLAYVAGESGWSKGQKDAVHALEHYARTGDETDWRAFQAGIAIPLGDRAAKLEMNRPTPDDAALRRAFAQGQIPRDDIEGMIWGYRTLKNTPWMRPAIAFWDIGDTYLLRLADQGERLHALAQADRLGTPEAMALVHEIQQIDAQLGPIEIGFSSALDDAARATRTLLMLVLALAACVLLGVFTHFIRRALDRSDRLEAEVRKNEERLTLGFEGINAGLWDWEIGRRRCYFSNWLYAQLGYDANTPFDTETDLTPHIHPDDLPRMRHALRRHLSRATLFDVEFRLRTLAGGYRWCRARGQAVRDANGRAVRMVGCLFDISDLKSAEAMACNARELAEVTLASIGEAVIRTDETARVTWCNAVAERMLGRCASEMIGQPFEAICALYDHAGDVTGNVDKAPRFDVFAPTPANEAPDLHIARPDGTRLAVDYSVSGLHDGGANRDTSIGSVVVLYDVSALREHAARLAYQATHDELTDIYNRREFERRLAALIDESAHAPRDAALHACSCVGACAGHSVMFLDLDQFKVVNDTCGHSTGDELIRQVCAVLKSTLRAGDIVARLGGDEFAVVLPHCTGALAWRLAENLREAIAAIRFTGAGRVVQTSVSIGLVSDAAALASVKEVMKAADVACYMAKEKGRNRVHRFRADDEELSQTHTQMSWVADIKAALENDQFCLYGQKILALAGKRTRETHTRENTDDTEHVELLLRMRSAAGALVPPSAFIGAAERFDLMPAIDRWVIARAFATIAAGVHRFDTWSINLSGASLGDEQLADYIEEQQRRYAIPFARVCFEITETAAITNLRSAIALIERLRAQGCRFALDDFGAGMSSLNYLKHLNVDYLKIDGSFIRGILDTPLDQAIVRAINQVAHAAGKLTIAEFVENAAIVDCMIAMDVDFAQGYGVGMPVPLDLLALAQPRHLAEQA